MQTVFNAKFSLQVFVRGHYEHDHTFGHDVLFTNVILKLPETDNLCNARRNK